LKEPDRKQKYNIYSRKVGSHVGGYDEWSVDITEAIRKALADPDCRKRFNGKVPLSIRCDNSRDTEMIPSDLSDFNVYGGLYRYVNLIYQPALSFASFKLETPVQKDLKSATLKVQANFYNPNDTRQATVRFTLKDPNGKKVTEQTATDILPLGEVHCLTMLSRIRCFGVLTSHSYTLVSLPSKQPKANRQ